ncbi:bacterio-opsin activator domain-containing protein [Halorussus marinus]|uniref:bacterio-opsin activator domain-containing protein n=1 Tax=Halorussus marinus TaxID=2505976 RepID=UPI00106E2480|nr:bacterio-opsin activator domain-containing protein [Halorussus marinus]
MTETQRDLDDLRRRVHRLEAVVETSPDPMALKDDAGRYRFVNAATAEYLDREPSDVVGATDVDLFGAEIGRRIRRQERAVREIERTQTFEETLRVGGRERVFETTRSPYYDPTGDLAGTVTVCRDVTDRIARERTLETQRDQLATLNRINDVTRGVIRRLIGEPSREDIERSVCERVLESTLYQFAWIGAPEPAGERVTGVAGAGLDDDLREIIADADASEDSDQPLALAYYDAEPQVVENVSDHESLDADRREAFVERGVESGIAVPIRYGDATYGVLAVGSERPAAFSQPETDAFELLGEVVGFAIDAVNHRRLALSPTVTEVEFRLTDTDSFYLSLTEAFDCTLELEGMTPGPDGSLLFYDSVTDVDPDAVLAFAADWDGIEDARIVSDGPERTLFEFTATGASVVLALSEHGAHTTEAVADRGEGRIVAELPADADLRAVIERVRAAFPDVELVAKRDREREVRSAREFRRELSGRLTEAQRSALRATYFAGYYNWPRDSTAEEVADSLGIASPTLHQHLRKAERELLGAFFDDELGGP